jgi:histidinol-phosphate aminotransferase
MYAFDCAISGMCFCKNQLRVLTRSTPAGQIIDVPRGSAPDFKIDVPAIKAAVQEHKPKVLFLTSPNNPDGTVIDPSDIDTILELPVLVVLDEAYIEFCETQQSRMQDVLVHENLIVLRTFSKRAALAGKRM